MYGELTEQEREYMGDVLIWLEKTFPKKHFIWHGKNHLTGFEGYELKIWKDQNKKTVFNKCFETIEELKVTLEFIELQYSFSGLIV